MNDLTPDDWKEFRLGDISSLITKGTTPKKYSSEGVNFVKVESVSNSATLIPSKFAYIDIATHESLKRSQLQAGDILFSIAGSLGRLAVVNNQHLPGNTNQALAIIR
jgi:type I restriction enzyme S subunit